MTTISNKTITENKYKQIKHLLLASCYNMMERGYTIGGQYGVLHTKNKWYWKSTGDKSVNPLGAYLLDIQPYPVILDFYYDPAEWDYEEQACLANEFNQSEDFFCGFISGYDEPYTPYKQLMKDILEDNNHPVDAPTNIINNKENFRLGVKLGKYFSKKFLLIRYNVW